MLISTQNGDYDKRPKAIRPNDKRRMPKGRIPKVHPIHYCGSGRVPKGTTQLVLVLFISLPCILKVKSREFYLGNKETK